MPLGLIPAAAAAYFAWRARNRRNDNQRAATTAGLNIAQQRGEDSRRARLDLGVGYLNGVPSTTAGGRVNTNVRLDPELVARLGRERTYDFGSAVPDENAGGGSAFLAGLINNLGDAADETAANMAAPGAASVPGGVPGLTLDQLLRLGRTGGPNTPTPVPNSEEYE